MFLIGEFSQIAQIATSQLRYYDEIGLLKPAHIDQWTNYRYYSVAQLPELHRILALRELGLSLDQIKRMVADDISVDEIRGMYALRKAQIEQTIESEIGRLRTIEARLNHLSGDGRKEDQDIVVKAIPELPFIGTRIVLPSIYDGFDIAQMMRHDLPNVVGRSNMRAITLLFHSDFFRHTDADVSLGYVLNRPTDQTLLLPNGSEARPQLLPPVPMMATAIRHGGPEHNIETHAAVGAWAEQNRYRLLGGGREMVITPPHNRDDREEMVTEIQIPVAPREDG